MRFWYVVTSVLVALDIGMKIITSLPALDRLADLALFGIAALLIAMKVIKGPDDAKHVPPGIKDDAAPDKADEYPWCE